MPIFCIHNPECFKEFIQIYVIIAIKVHNFQNSVWVRNLLTVRDMLVDIFTTLLEFLTTDRPVPIFIKELEDSLKLLPVGVKGIHHAARLPGILNLVQMGVKLFQKDPVVDVCKPFDRFVWNKGRDQGNPKNLKSSNINHDSCPVCLGDQAIVAVVKFTKFALQLIFLFEHQVKNIDFYQRGGVHCIEGVFNVVSMDRVIYWDALVGGILTLSGNIVVSWWLSHAVLQVCTKVP
mmetsp:Transcript_35624/g.45737  ORF Transcript_35624/g.45737 Transcript_35624/m.45737 type:complete len:234 (-) Transcript_35624:1526-2227(-)